MESTIIQEREVTQTENELSLSELHEPVWSVVSFEKCIESSLTYDEAVRKMDELLSQKASGLCIITDEAAKNI